MFKNGITQETEWNKVWILVLTFRLFINLRCRFKKALFHLSKVWCKLDIFWLHVPLPKRTQLIWVPCIIFLLKTSWNTEPDKDFFQENVSGDKKGRGKITYVYECYNNNFILLQVFPSLSYSHISTDPSWVWQSVNIILFSPSHFLSKRLLFFVE